MKEIQDYVQYHLLNQKFMKPLPEFTHRAYFKSQVCGDANELYLKVSSAGIVEDIGYLQVGCGLNIALLENFCSNIYLKKFSDIDFYFQKTLTLFDKVSENKIHCKNLFSNTINILSVREN